MSKWAKYLTKWKTWWKREDGWKRDGWIHRVM